MSLCADSIPQCRAPKTSTLQGTYRLIRVTGTVRHFMADSGRRRSAREVDFQRVRALSPLDSRQRQEYFQWFLRQSREDSFFNNRVLFTDESEAS